MRSLFIVSILGFLVSQNSMAEGMFQTDIETSNWRFGLSARQSMETMNETPPFAYEYPGTYNYSLSIVRDYLIHPKWHIRNGVGFDQRSGVARINNGVTTNELSHRTIFAEFPIFLVRKIGEDNYFFAGPVVGFKAASLCTFKSLDCSLVNEKTVILPWQVGVEFSVMNKFSMGVYYESGPGKYSDEFVMNSGAGIFFMTSPRILDENEPSGLPSPAVVPDISSPVAPVNDKSSTEAPSVQ